MLKVYILNKTAILAPNCKRMVDDATFLYCPASFVKDITCNEGEVYR